jgi:hypothetical protein
MVHLCPTEPVPSSLMALRNFYHAISDFLIQRIMLSVGVYGYLIKVLSIYKYLGI